MANLFDILYCYYQFYFKTLPYGNDGFNGFSNIGYNQHHFNGRISNGLCRYTVWLVVAAFLIAGGVISSGIGKRIALNLISWFGKSILGLAYSICGTELILGPVVPSNTARGGGIIAPIVNSISHSLGSKSDENPKKVVNS